MILNLLSYNIRYGGVGREHHLADVLQEVDPDLVVFQEATRPDVIERLAANAGMTSWAARVGHSLGFMSRIAVAHYGWHHPRGARHSFIEIAPAMSTCRIFGLHFRAIHSNWTERWRLRELQAMLKAIKQHQDGLHVLVGDFNTLAPGEVLNLGDLPRRLRLVVRLTGRRIQWQTIKALLQANYVDGFRLLHPEEPGFTFPTWAPHVRLDYTFIPAAFSDRLKSCEVVNGVVGAAQASDHFPVLARIEI